MADNVQVTAGAGTVIATELISGSTIAHHQRIKMVLGDKDVDGGDVSIANPMPVVISSGTFGTITITGSVSVINSITGSTTIVSMPSVTGSVTVLGGTAGTASTNVITIQGIAGGVAQLITGSTTILGTVSITGSTSVINVVTITGSTTIVGTVNVSGNITITGSTSILNVVAITGSTSILSMPTVTGSVSVINVVSMTGSTTTVNIQFPSSSTASINVTTAGTSILIPSTSTNSIYVTDLVISNGATAGNVSAGMGTGVIAPTTTSIKIQPLYFAVNGGLVWTIQNPIKLNASTNFLITAVSCTTLSITATYYVSP